MSKQPGHLDDKITIRKQNRRTLAMRLSPYGQIDVLIPYWVKPNSREVKRFIKEIAAQARTHYLADHPDAAPQHHHTQAADAPLAQCLGEEDAGQAIPGAVP